MKLWAFAVLLGCLAAAGCHVHRHGSRLLEQENRQLEDALYEFQYDLETSQLENESLRKRLGRYESVGPSTGPSMRLEADAPELLSPRSGRPSMGEIAPLRPPTVELGTEVAPPEYIPETRVPSRSPEFRGPLEAPPTDLPANIDGEDSGSAGEFVMPPLSVPERSDGDHLGRTVSTESGQVARIAVNPKLSGGYDVDGRPGDEGIIVVIEPQTDDRRLVAAAAPVSVVLLDPNLPGEAARVARWDFSVDEVARIYGESPPGTGLRLKLTWPGAPPVHSRLHLFVQYTTTDGTGHEADGEIRVALAGLSPRDWSPPTRSAPANVTPRTARRDVTGWQRRPTPARKAVGVFPPKPNVEPIRTAARRMPANAPPARERPTWAPER